MTDGADEQTILFFDGICHLCDSAVDFLVSREKNGRLLYATLQGKTAAAQLSEADRRELNTVVLLENGVIYRRSTALLKAVCLIQGPWSWAARAAFLVPRPLRDIIYDFIARHRYRWFGQRDHCRLPTKEERGRFLD